MGKSIIMLLWLLTSVIKAGRQTEAEEQRKGSTEDRRVTLITSSMAGSSWPEVTQGWEARQACIPPKM